MPIYYHIIDKQNEIVLNNFPDYLFDVISLIDNKKDINIFSTANGKIKCRTGYKKRDEKTLYLLSTEKKHLGGTKMFNQLLSILGDSIPAIESIQTSIIQKQQKITDEFIHNVTNINSQAIQDLNALIPEKLLKENINKQKDTVNSIINDKPIKTSETLLNLLKYNLSMKIEFSVFERTLEEFPVVQKSNMVIRKVILSVSQMFITDFDKRKVAIYLENNEKVLNIDSDLMLVSLYYIFDNAVKYCAGRSKLHIGFKESEHGFIVFFRMLSAKIESNEIDRLCTLNYRSASAKKLNSDGKGIGMYRIQKTLKMNDIQMNITPRVSPLAKSIKGVTFEENEFSFCFKNQQDWFALK